MSSDEYTGLKIIKASAGSGKTHRLTFEYIKLVLSSPSKFKNILAVTFTNKATAEMKSRILSELQILAKTPDKSRMIDKLANDLKLSKSQLSQNASQIVKSILHEYAHFNVSTIDHFFQNIIRNLTKELGLNGGFRIQLDQNEIIEAAVENFLHDLGGNEGQMKIMLEYIDSQMEDEKSWNVNRHLINFTKQLFREQVRYFFIKNNGSINGKSNTQTVKAKLFAIINSFETKTKDWIDAFEAIIEKSGLQREDFTGKSRNPLFSAKTKLETKKYGEIDKNLSKIQEQQQWAHKDSPNAKLVESLASEFDKLTDDLNEIFYKYYPEYIEANTIQKHFFQHSLASGLMKKVSELLAEQNLFMLADAPVLLNLFTDGDDTPFIYEKSGRIFQHFMIDEFQDTSVLQWENFKPLLQESLALGNKGNFIVGDVKQAIYRWRNGDWTLLHKKVAEQIQQTKNESLTNNWRSQENIIQFNNHFFKELINIAGRNFGEHYQKELQDIYDDIEQTIPHEIEEKRKGGYVYLKEIDESKREEFLEASLRELKHHITTLKEKYSIEDICILVRKNAELELVTEFLINETNYEIISSGSLSLSNSNILQLIITFIRYLNTPDPLFSKTISYLLLKSRIDKSELHNIFKAEYENSTTKKIDDISKELKQESILEIIKTLVNRFDLLNIYPNQEIFLSRFYNEVKQLTFDKGGNFNGIIEWWETKGETINIEISENNSSGIKVMTIHKSKGLQFQHVVIPFAQWASPNKQDTLWLPGNSFRFDELHGGLYPVNLSKSHLFCENLAPYYEAENFATTIDLINVLYVAATRAEEGLHIFYHKKPHSKNDISRFISETMENSEEISKLLTLRNENSFEIGKLKTAKLPAPQEKSKVVIHFTNNENIAIKPGKQSIFRSDNYENFAAELGSFWHKIFEQIITFNDIDQAVNRQIELGNINKTQAQIIKDQISSWLKEPNISFWFSNKVKVITEAEILVPQKSTKRPDRIVIHANGTDIIDYKFGRKESESYKKQVKEYCQLFEKMNFKNIKGFIWYPLLNKVIEV